MNLPSKRFSTLLAISLLLNVFLAGTIAGGGYRWATRQKAPAVAQSQRNLRAAVAELSEARQQALRRALRQTRRDSRPLAVSARMGRQDVIDALTAPNFDRGALDAALARTREADVALRARVEGTVADFVTTLTPEERLRLAEALRRPNSPQPRSAGSAGRGGSPANADETSRAQP